MQILSRIAVIRCRAERLNRSLLWCCRKTGTHYSTVRSWELGRNEPNMRTLRKVLDPIEALLDGEEARLRAALDAPLASSGAAA